LKFTTFLIISLGTIFAITPVGYLIVLDVNNMTQLDENTSDSWKEIMKNHHDNNIFVVLVGIPLLTFCISFMFWSALLRDERKNERVH